MTLVSPENASRFSMKLAKILGATEADLTDPAKRVKFFRTADAATICGRADEVAEYTVKKSSRFIIVAFLHY